MIKVPANDYSFYWPSDFGAPKEKKEAIFRCLYFKSCLVLELIYLQPLLFIMSPKSDEMWCLNFR